jgi:hypothetical protein
MSGEKMTEADKEGEGLSPHWAKVAKDSPQHWDRMWLLYREAWFVANITKYAERYRNKNGLEDLKKARNYLNKLMELEEKAAQDPDLAERMRIHLRQELLDKRCDEGHLEGFDPDNDPRSNL